MFMSQGSSKRSRASHSLVEEMLRYTAEIQGYGNIFVSEARPILVVSLISEGYATHGSIQRINFAALQFTALPPEFSDKRSCLRQLHRTFF